ncbi:polyribonucleotide nucleotidyltransferase [Patescibacteria group bacterium]|nr:polyribonucleotide nucleotidyltransferase [Patescibacteria group bacterium]
MQFETEIGGKKLIVKIGDLANQANGSCVVQYGETTVLGTAVMGDEEKELDYFPLSVEYEERFYAAGRLKGSRFIKRETRPPDEAILTARLIDRTIRPLFDSESRRAVQVILTVLSFDSENDADMVALYAALIALSISDINWDGPVAGVRVARILANDSESAVKSGSGSEWILNPSYEERANSDLDLVICGTDNRVVMVEAESKEVTDEVMLEAIKYGTKHFDKINQFIKEIQEKVGRPKVSLISEITTDEDIAKEEIKKMTEELVKAEAPKYLFKKVLKTKEDRIEAAKEIRARLEEFLIEKNIGKEKRIKAINYANKLIYGQVSQAILDDGKRIDGRAMDELRPLTSQVGILPRVHGSGLFSRGETQILSVVTLGSPGDEQYLDTMEEKSKKRFMHHYNFPPFCSGEVKNARFTSRREIGHGVLGEKGILPILPDKEVFPHTIRIVSEALSSNGSTSMAAVCSSVLAAMDAGIPIKRPVAGIAIGLASEEDEKGIKRYKILTDIQDLEDGPGGMDFKIIGSNQGITAMQMDTKTKGLTFDIIKDTFTASSKVRAEILKQMSQAIKEPRANLSPYAPKIVVFKIDPEKIREVIGPGGKMINKIIDETGAAIDIEQDGTVSITSADEQSLKKAVTWVKDITRKFEVGEMFQGKVTRIMDFGAFIELVPGREGMVHVSEMAETHVDHPNDVVKVDDIVKVKIIEIDKMGRVNLSMNTDKTSYRPRPAPRRSFNSRGSRDRGPRR